MKAPAEATSFVSVAWLLKGLFGSSQPCLLRLAAGRLVLICGSDPVFDVPLNEVRAVFPWYYFSGGVKLRTAARSFRLSFVKPNSGARSVDAFADEVAPLTGVFAFADLAGDVTDVARSVRGMSRGRDAGKEWKRLLPG